MWSEDEVVEAWCVVQNKRSQYPEECNGTL